jgi:SAM-dependent methyltransferase
MAFIWEQLLDMVSWLPDRWEAPDRGFFGHRDIVTQSLSRYNFVAPHVRGALLDVGCGRGYGFEILTREDGIRVGIDISTDFLTEAREQYPGVFFACCSGDELSLDNSSFDSIVAFEVIEHAKDDLHFLEELKRVSRKDGLIAISTPNRLISSGSSDKPLDRFHHREYEAAEFYRLLMRNFSTVELFGQHERVNSHSPRNRLVDRIPIRWKYCFPHYMQGLLSVTLRPPLRLEDCVFLKDDLEQAQTFVALCQA